LTDIVRSKVHGLCGRQVQHPMWEGERNERDMTLSALSVRDVVGPRRPELQRAQVVTNIPTVRWRNHKIIIETGTIQCNIIETRFGGAASAERNSG